MKTILSEKVIRILKNKKKLEKLLNLKITNRGKEVTIKGEPEDEFLGGNVIDALNFGFPFSNAILIKTQDFMFGIMNIKDHSHKKDLKTVRARIIGRKGKTLKTLTELTGCHFELENNEIGIIGDPEDFENGKKAMISIIQGSKQSNIYCFLKKQKRTNTRKKIE